ncbi:phosphoserine phosphatase SerB [Kordiimonas sp. SCSIO 12610]|uniref:phosphoserine phosphatase SerB n=1 Tax=Kordiimonas sp. SCSIO 12610 TaxID=2829597 RepID=UPI00210D4BE9|nr:phosphoserine phosphatase SerB [Kordiimonas sp. SCSIO 12610]UTW54424.1 phosphoserine phosphatase SerB [Kordiimonas sp. SCSIO 12610]
MNMVLTLVVNPNNSDILNKAIALSQELLNNHYNINDIDHSILSEDEAIDLAFEVNEGDGPSIKSTLTETLSSYPIDWALQNTADRKKKLLLADMDSTMITVECIDELADFASLKDKVSAITEAAMRGELDFQDALRERVALLKGLNTDVLDRCFAERITVSDGAETALSTMSGAGAYSALVSGGFTFFTEKVANKLGFSMHRANILGINDSTLTGEVIPPICDASTKEETLKELQSQQNLSVSDIIAVGDGANDIPMLNAAGLGVAYKAKPVAQEAADACINHTSLETLLFFQGFTRSSFK